MTANPPSGAKREVAFEQLRHAVRDLLGSERRLRGREHNQHGGLTHAQLRALATLGREDAMTAGQLAKQADLNPASVTAMLDQLEAADVVQRQRSSEDRRVCNVSLTARGWELLEQKRALWYALWEERFADLSDRELEAATKVIAQVAEMFDAA